jgi:alkanesulfonate monooxygenase SsuD/methylene tetrahydromethanopterin reductase-like flavin-dependent oxidoreductase (luciferase family)
MRPFRFGVVAAAQASGTEWQNTARRAEQLGYSTLLTPDNLYLPTPTASLATAAAVTSRLRVGSFVLASPLRTARCQRRLNLNPLASGENGPPGGGC